MRLPIPAAASVLILTVYVIISDTRLQGADTNVDVCEVLQHPQTFNGKMISIRTRIRIEFEDFEIDTPSCANKVIDGIWLEYGKGPKKQPTIWCCGDLTPADQLGLIQDSAFRMATAIFEQFEKASLFMRYPRPYRAGSMPFLQRNALMASTSVHVMVDSDIWGHLHPV
jgi:hypothetical protein